MSRFDKTPCKISTIRIATNHQRIRPNMPRAYLRRASMSSKRLLFSSVFSSIDKRSRSLRWSISICSSSSTVRLFRPAAAFPFRGWRSAAASYVRKICLARRRGCSSTRTSRFTAILFQLSIVTLLLLTENTDYSALRISSQRCWILREPCRDIS